MADTISNTNVLLKPLANSDKKLKVAIVDDFTTKSIFVDGDNTPDIAHGKIMKRFIEEGLPEAQIDSFDIKSSYGAEMLMGTNSQLSSILQNINDGQKYDALNISLSGFINFSYLSKLMGKQITPENILQYKGEIKKWLDSQKDLTKITMHNNENLTQENEIIQKLDEISAKGVKIYIAAGNSADTFNAFSLAENVKTVGALDLKGDKMNEFSNNSLINSWALGISQINKVQDSKGKLGFDITGDGSIDIYADETSSFFKFTGDPIRGTSGATPIALVRDFKQLKK